MTKDKNLAQPEKRPPVVVVMGHVDHGKTTLLDYIRKTAIAAKAAPRGGEPRPVAGREAGGITQSIGAYEITHTRIENKEQKTERITFIDTPGHEAFSKMRARGAKVADIAILIVAADDGVKPQTKEALKIIQEAKIPFVIAINKIDKSNADMDRVKNELMQAGVLLEGYGGNISWQAISAKTGQGVDELLDLILLTAEMEELNYNPANPAKGFVLEARMDSRRGITAVVIIKDGILKTGDELRAGAALGSVRILENFLGKKIDSAIPSSPALILGFEALPKIGEEFITGQFEGKMPLIDVRATRTEKTSTAAAKTKVILKADVSGSLEALSEVIKNIPRPSNSEIEIINESIGDITDGDVNAATAAKAAIVGFKVKINKAAENLAKSQSVKIIQSDIIYELVKAVEKELASSGSAIILGELEILAIFGKKGPRQQVVGGKVIAGEIKNNSILEIARKNETIGKGKILNLQQNKKDFAKVEAGNECGLLFDSEVMINAGDHLISK